MKCIIGLGNIGREYEHTRHNIGFMCIDEISRMYNCNFDRKLKKCIYGETVIEGKKIILAKPTTYMNLSGEAVVELINWFKMDISDICIIYDDIDLPFGSIRYRERGSGGTHNGMKNIVELAGSENIKRIRVGIESRNEGSKFSLSDFVLGKFSNDELEKIDKEIHLNVKESIQNFCKN